MPDITRLPVRLSCENGLDLVTPVDRMKPGSYSLMYNCRVVTEGAMEGRPGYTPYGSVGGPKLLHSIRRLNDPDESVAANGYIYIVGNGTQLWAGIETALSEIDSGYSGNPLSILTFRPDVSPETWAYVYDQNKQSKVNAAGVVRAIGVAPPNTAPLAEYGIPATVSVTDGQDATGWTVSGLSTGITLSDRQSGAANAIAYILYNSGTTGWCCFFVVSGTSGDYSWAGERMKLILNPSGGNQETVVVREIHPGIANTTVQEIQYDTGTTGLCSVVLNGSPAGLARNSLLGFNAEVVRVLSVTLSPDGSVYSFRCSTVGAYMAGTAITGLISWYAWTANNHVPGEPIATSYLAVTQASTGSGSGTVALKVAENAGTANGRPIDPANDYLHVSLFFANAANLVSVELLVDVDSGTPLGTPFTGNYYTWTLTPNDLQISGGVNIWVDVSLPLSSAQRIGGDLSRNFTTVEAVGITVTTTGACSYGFDWWYNFGTYGPVIQPNAPVGYFYDSTFRDSSTGATSVPGPTTRYSLNPLREAVLVTPATTVAGGIDYSDIYREGGTLDTFTYVGSVQNNNAAPNSYLDGNSDETIASNPAVDLTQIQPWPILGLPLAGVVNVIGTTVIWVSGDKFPLALISNSVILLNGTAYETRGHPRSDILLELELDAGVLTNAAYSIQSPTLTGQPLPFAFGPLEGPFAPVSFALGDPVNAGTLYYSNTSNLDSASDQNTIELCGPTEPLVSGEVWSGLAFAGSRENVYLIRYSFAQGLIAGASQFQWSRLPSASGFWCRWAICRGPDGVYALGRDGLYRFTEQGGENISDAQLYPLFPHDGQPAAGAPGYLPVDMTQINFMRLSAQDNEIRFTYLDTGTNQVTLRYEVTRKRWFPHFYADAISYEYLNEPLVSSPNNLSILQLSRTLGEIYQVGGNLDNAAVVESQLVTPAFDGGDQRILKLPTDYIVDADQVGNLTIAQFYNNNELNSPAIGVSLNGPRIQSIINISQVATTLQSYRNISVKMVWQGGPSGPRIYAIEPAWYPQPYISTRVMTNFIGLSFPGWKMARRLYAGMISTAPTTFLIQTQDGRQFTTTIPSTNGQFLIQPIMLPQCIKALSAAYQVDGGGIPFALFTDDFVVEYKEWSESTFVKLAIFRT